MATTSSRRIAQASRGKHDSTLALRHAHEVSSCPFYEKLAAEKLVRTMAKGGECPRSPSMGPKIEDYTPLVNNGILGGFSFFADIGWTARCGATGLQETGRRDRYHMRPDAWPSLRLRLKIPVACATKILGSKLVKTWPCTNKASKFATPPAVAFLERRR
jgi:hypothetical protein